jgi:hypothetical protein
MNLKLFLSFFLFDSLEYLIASNWNYSLVGSIAYHAVGFARTCLAISEEAAMITLPGIV